MSNKVRLIIMLTAGLILLFWLGYWIYNQYFKKSNVGLTNAQLQKAVINAKQAPGSPAIQQNIEGTNTPYVEIGGVTYLEN